MKLVKNFAQKIKLRHIYFVAKFFKYLRAYFIAHVFHKLFYDSPYILNTECRYFKIDIKAASVILQ